MFQTRPDETEASTEVGEASTTDTDFRLVLGLFKCSLLVKPQQQASMSSKLGPIENSTKTMIKGGGEKIVKLQSP